MNILENAGRWLLESGIQEPSGGVARYHLLESGRNLPVSTEITGYAASAFCYLYRRTGVSAYLAAAVRASQFLAREAWNGSLRTFPFELAPGSPAYFFDCGIIARGLLAVWRVTRDQEPLDIAYACGRSMARDFLTPDAIHPVVSLPDRSPLPYENRWSRQPGCFLLKSALAWRELAEITGDPDFREHWQQAIRLAVANAPDFLPGSSDRLRVMDRLHAFCYYLEALLAADRPDLLAAGIERCAALLRDIAPEFVRSDVYAQVLRVRMLAAQLGHLGLDRTAAVEEASAIPAFQLPSGAFSFGCRDGALMPFANPVSTAFCLQALDWWSDANAGPSLHQLI